VKRITTPARVGAALVLAPAVMVLASGPALAASSVSVSNTETVQAHLNADGTVQDARVYEQIALQGNGTLTIKNPVSTKNLRNLDGFGAFDVKDGNMISTQTVSGEQRLRSVSDFGKVLPLKVAVTYKLDGKTVQAGDVVGKSGRLEVHYKVDNVTGKDQEVTYDDGTGKKVTETQKVVIPMVGSLSTLLPSSFTDVQSGEASMAGDGNGATSMTFTMTLFGPIGASTSEFGYSAAIKDGVIPDATISALPVSPLDNPSFKGGAASYKAGADSGVTLTAGAIEIDANVLKLRDGAQTLLAGLIQLRDGAQTLNAGLADSAAPGAIKLADGASQLKAGTSALSQGFNSTTGAADLVSGGGLIQAALQQISAGLTQLVDAKAGLPAALAGEKQIAFALDHPVHALGVTDPGGLLQGIQAIAGGLTLVSGGLDQLAAPAGLPAAKGGVDQVKAGLDAALVPGTGGVDQLRGGVALIKSGLDAALVPTTGDIDLLKGGAVAAQATTGCQSDPVCVGTLTAVVHSIDVTLRAKTQAASNGLSLSPAAVGGGLDKLRTDLTAADGGLGQVSAGLGTAITGVSTLQAGVGQLVAGNTTMQTGVQGLLIPGVNKLVVGLTAAVDGALKLNSGAAQASAGATTLAGKIVEAGAGAGLLNDGTVQLSDGAKQLATGLGVAATGSGQLSDGLAKAADGGKAIPAGASKLSAEGTSKLVEAGKATASDYGLKYALIVAGAERAKAEGMAYGAPAGATGATAYSLEISGANGNGGSNIGRGVGALALFGAGGGLALFRRRLV
jgi:putative membrane protein